MNLEPLTSHINFTRARGLAIFILGATRVRAVVYIRIGAEYGQLPHVHELARTKSGLDRVGIQIDLDVVLVPSDARLGLARYDALERVVRLRVELHRLEWRDHQRSAHLRFCYF